MLTSLIDISEAGPWVLLSIAILVAAGVITLISLAKRLREISERLEQLDGLEGLERSLSGLKEVADSVDLERLEHLVEDLRDTNRRIGRQLVDLTEGSVAEPSAGAQERPVGPMLAERITNRLIVLGCERIELLVGAGDLERVAAEGGEVGFEARRDGAAAKGRVQIADGRLVDVQVSTSHQMFP